MKFYYAYSAGHHKVTDRTNPHKGTALGGLFLASLVLTICSALTPLRAANGDFDSGWKGNLPTGLRYDAVTGIQFLSTAPSGYSKSDITYNGIYIYTGDTRTTDIAYVYGGTIKLTSGSYLFTTCVALTTVAFCNFNTAAATDMNGMFNGCSKLTAIDLGGFNTAKVTSMNSMFQNCSGLTGTFGNNGTAIKISGSFTTAAATNMSAMFYGCSKLTAIDLGGFNTEKVTDMNSMFSGCSGLTGTFGNNGTAIDISGSFTTAAATDMSRMFYGCSGLTAIDLSGFNTEKVTSMRYMFHGCSGLTGTFGNNGTAIKISGSFTTAAATDMSRMFDGCSGLTAIDLGGFDMTRVTSTADMLSYCTELAQIIAPANVGAGYPIALPKSYSYKKGPATATGVSTITSTTCSDATDKAVYSAELAITYKDRDGGRIFGRARHGLSLHAHLRHGYRARTAHQSGLYIQRLVCQKRLLRHGHYHTQRYRPHRSHYAVCQMDSE